MTTPEATRPTRAPIAPIWHTVTLVAFLFAIAGYGAYVQATAGPAPQLVEHRGSALPLYLGLIVGEWALLRFTLLGLRKGGTRMRDVIGGRWASWRDVARDVALALVVWAAWAGLEILASGALGPDRAKGITSLLPRDPAEVAAWVGLSLSAGICEEAVFRGYLQRQFGALSGNAGIAIAAQAIVFGVAHGYQGARNTIAIVVFGALFGALAHWRRSLRPGMILHAWTDVFSGIFASRV